MVYGKEFALPNSFDVTTQNVAVRSYDRYGVEHAAAEYGPDVTYVLNGGELEYTDEIEVPTNEELMLQFMEDYTKYYNITTSFVETFYNTKNVSGFLSRGKDNWSVDFTVKNMLTDANSGWKWLGDYIVQVVTAQSTTAVTTDALWRFNITAFFNQNKATAWPYSADFTTAGQPTAWGPAYIAAHKNIVLPDPPTNDELLANFKDSYNTYFNVTVSTSREIGTFLYAGYVKLDGISKSCNITDMMTDPASGWKWLGDYIISIAGTPSSATENWWRANVTAFFTTSQATTVGTTTSANFSTAGQQSAWGPAWQEAHKTTADPETSGYTLPDFIDEPFTLPTASSNPRIYHPSGYTFLGWKDSNGADVTTLSVGYKGTVYAQWNSPIKWVLNGGVYTGHEELPLTVEEEYYLPTANYMHKEGCKFVGWYTASDFSGNKLTSINADYTGTLYAKWEPATHVTWHPYPYYDVTNEDLWELFVEDYNAFYTNKEILGEDNVSSGEKDENISMTGAFGFTYSLNADKDKFPDGRLMEFMTHGKSPWKWLGDYITEVLEKENESLDSNAPLWTSFKEATGLTHLGALENITINTICSKNALYSGTQQDGSLVTNDDGSTEASILNALFEQNEWKWLKEYIMTTQNNYTGATKLTDNIEDSRRQWAFAVAAFFKQSQRTEWPKSADFSTAGKHSVWKEIIPEEYHELGHFRITNQIEWRKTVAAFFNHTNVLTYTLNSGTTKTEGTADFRTLGLPRPNGDPEAGWYNAWWNATFPEYMINREALPRIKRKGYLFGGWYYGNEKGYIFAEGTKADPASYSSANTDYKNHLWGRWLELCLYEGYVDSDPAALGADGLPISPKVNNNYELASCSDGKSHKIDVERKLVGGAYNTMFLPFGINGQGSVQKDDNGNYIPGSGKCGKRRYLEQVVDDQGNKLLDPDKTSILVFDNATVETVGGEDVISFNFHEYAETDSLETLGVYQPILIKPENDITTRMHFWSALMWKPATPKARTDASQANVEGVLAPTVIPVNPEGDNILILVADNRLAKVTASGEMLGLRLYFTVPKEVSSSARSIIRIKDAPTEVENINTPQQGAAAIKVLRDGTIYILRDGKIYDIMGRSLGEL